MKYCTRINIFLIFIFLHLTCCWTSIENNGINERLLVLEDLLTDMENIIRETNVKVAKAQNKLENTGASLERDFARLQKSEKRKMRKGYRQIMKEVKVELDYDTNEIKEIIESIQDIYVKGSDVPEADLVNETVGLEISNIYDPDESQDQGVSRTEEQRIFFKAANLTKKKYSVGDTIVFPEVFDNIGGGYDPENGLFVTPMTGTYYFTVQLYIFSGVTTDVGIYVDDECIAWGKLTPNWNSCENFAVVVTLKRGDVVYVKQISETWPNAYNITSRNLLNSFSGVFIR